MYKFVHAYKYGIEMCKMHNTNIHSYTMDNIIIQLNMA